MDRKRAGILISNEVEVLDFCGPYEVFSATRLNAGIDMALRVVARSFGEAVARSTARQMEYACTTANAQRIEKGNDQQAYAHHSTNPSLLWVEKPLRPKISGQVASSA